MVIEIISKDITKNNDNLLYSEWIPLAKIVKIVIISLIFFLFILLFYLIIIFASEPQVITFLLFTLGGLCVLFLFIYWNFRGVQITLTKNQIKVKYGIFNHKIISLKKIMRCEIIKATFKKYGGIGIRLGFDGSWAYTTDFGEAIKLTYQNGGRPFVFSTRNPQKISNLISKLSK